MRNLKFDLSNENFDYWFARQTDKITEEQKDSLPKELNFKLFRKGGEFNATSFDKLNFISKLFVLIKALRYRWILVVEDEKNGMNPDQFFEYRSQVTKYKYALTNSEVLSASGFFVLGNKELMDTFSLFNHTCVGPAYNYVSKIKNAPPNKVTEWRQKSRAVVDFLANYESQKKRIVMQRAVSMAELYTLFYLYDGNERTASDIYKSKFRYAYNASRAQIQAAFVTLQNRGLIEKIGYKKGARLKITALGMIEIDEIVDRYLRNF